MAQPKAYTAKKASSPSGAFSSSHRSHNIPHIETRTFKYGVINYPQPDNIPRGASPNSMNFLTKGDRVETRNGYAPLGPEQKVAGSVMGVKTAHKWDGTEVAFKANGSSLYYYDSVNGVWTEVGTNLLAGANGEDISFAEYISPSGAQLWVSSPSTGLFKIMTANPGTAKNLQVNAKNFRGRIKILLNRMWLWNYPKTNQNQGSQSNVALSYIDAQAYSTVIAENLANGDGVTKTFTGNLANVTASSLTTAFAIQLFATIGSPITITGITQSKQPQVTATAHGLTAGQFIIISGVSGMTQINGLIMQVASVIDANTFLINIDTSGYTMYSSGGSATVVEYFTDDFLGKLSSNLGGTGTINYSTGAYSVTFNTAPNNGSNTVQCTYSYEDSTNTGVADFTHAGTRLAGQGAIFLQGDGGSLLNVCEFNAIEYCMHERKTWQLNIQADDTTATNLIYRKRVTPASWQSCIETSYGIFYVDVTNKSKPYFAVIELNDISQQVLPRDLSSMTLDLSGYMFDKAFALEWNEYICFFARTTASVKNDTLFLYNRTIGTWDVCDFFGNCADVYGGTLIAGDSATPNVYTLFSGWDDDGANPNYLWDSNQDNYGTPDLKKARRLYLEGYIDINQSVNILCSTDNGSFVKIGTVKGSGSYVDRNQAVLIGSLIVGKYEIGGGSNGATAFHYQTQIKLYPVGKFQKRQIRLQPTGIGYFSCQMMTDYDIRLNKNKLPSKYR